MALAILNLGPSPRVVSRRVVRASAEAQGVSGRSLPIKEQKQALLRLVAGTDRGKSVSPEQVWVCECVYSGMHDQDRKLRLSSIFFGVWACTRVEKSV